MKNTELENNIFVSKETINNLMKIKADALTIYLILLNKQEHNGYYVGNQKDLAKEINISIATLNKYIKVLKENGYLKTIRQGQKKGTIYIVNLEKSA